MTTPPHHSLIDKSEIDGLPSISIQDLLKSYDASSLEKLENLRNKFVKKGFLYALNLMNQWQPGSRPEGLQNCGYLLTFGDRDPLGGRVRFRRDPERGRSAEAVIDISVHGLKDILEAPERLLPGRERTAYDRHLGSGTFGAVSGTLAQVVKSPPAKMNPGPHDGYYFVNEHPAWYFADTLKGNPYLEAEALKLKAAAPVVGAYSMGGSGRHADYVYGLASEVHWTLMAVALQRMRTLISERLAEIRAEIRSSPEIQESMAVQKSIAKTEDVLKVLASLQQFKAVIDSLVGGITKDTLGQDTIDAFSNQTYAIRRNCSRFSIVLRKHYVTAKKKA